MFDDDRTGCLGGLLKLLLLGWLFDWLQDNFGFGCGLPGCGCGIIFTILFFILACGIVCSTDWLRLFPAAPVF
ncbi:MAG: hypothetical protein JXB47_03900 [Anaerolineae bacterium]|nr:hypothetical protein [Anaerolineae bacterium]